MTATCLDNPRTSELFLLASPPGLTEFTKKPAIPILSRRAIRSSAKSTIAALATARSSDLRLFIGRITAKNVTIAATHPPIAAMADQSSRQLATGDAQGIMTSAANIGPSPYGCGGIVPWGQPMADGLQLSFADAVERTAHDLAGMSGVDLADARPAAVRLWHARGLALHHLAAGDKDEALKVMAAARGSCPRTGKHNPNQPRDAAKETR